eukprot:CAMPEP_0172792758 /NCGR_PEP_ID=MMETSP1074-20121228/209134_1 /TAXON_ID=2916 /ORGANISM="Ceratium fusus, Strain PA161109" /LENGTH=129 /DNA_ID=CAMNT_0013629827 /DNA_START=649 /DNA_END=1038 /DNA_ORIENTATION=+
MSMCPAANDLTKAQVKAPEHIPQSTVLWPSGHAGMLRTGGSGKQEVLEVQAIEDVAVVADQEALHAMLQLAAVAYPPTVLKVRGKVNWLGLVGSKPGSTEWQQSKSTVTLHFLGKPARMRVISTMGTSL